MKNFIFAAVAALFLMSNLAMADAINYQEIPCPEDAIVDENQIPADEFPCDNLETELIENCDDSELGDFPDGNDQPGDDEANPDKVCFCHNITHNPVTLCTSQQGLINGHMKHVNGEVPDVEDSLGECPDETPVVDCDVENLPDDSPCYVDDEEEPAPSEQPTEDDEQPVPSDTPAEDDGEPAVEQNPPADQGSTPIDPFDAQDLADQVTGDGIAGTPFDPLLFEGSGCQLNAAAGSESAALWVVMAILPALSMSRAARHRKK